jgi:hypothetical protein
MPVLGGFLPQKDSRPADLATIGCVLNRTIVKDTLTGLSVLYSFLRVLTLIRFRVHVRRSWSVHWPFSSYSLDIHWRHRRHSIILLLDPDIIHNLLWILGQVITELTSVFGCGCSKEVVLRLTGFDITA